MTTYSPSPMSKYFNIKICPLCQKPLYVKYIDGHTVAYRCTTLVREEVPGISYEKSNEGEAIKSIDERPHYEVLIDNGNALQTTIAPPYRMTTLAGTGKTRVFKWPVSPIKGDTSFIMEIPVLIPDRDADKLASKIKIYILFS
jgi:hypothetical protein